MNLAGGKIIRDEDRQTALDELEGRVLQTLAKERLNPQTVLDACDALSASLSDKHLPLIMQLGYDREAASEYLQEVKTMLSRDYLSRKLETELGPFYDKDRQYIPLDRTQPVTERRMPVGVILHIAAGNADGLPAFTVIEGLLAGNINILKLPSHADPVSGQILMALIEKEPVLADYIYVFDYTSKDLEAMKKMAELADAVVVWGSDAAVAAVRQMVQPDTRIIEWGHKISFAYLTESGMTEENLRQLAEHICKTDQLLCSSCQGIFIDTDDMDTVNQFCERFIEILEAASQKYPRTLELGLQAEVSLQMQNEELESVFNGNKLYRKEGCSVIAASDHLLEVSAMFRNCRVKRLPRRDLLSVLRPYKNHLQTVGLLCSASEKQELADMLMKTGVVRVTDGGHMSSMYCGAPHDGEYSLQRYTKLVTLE